MLTSLKVENFRCFKSFELQELGRINLLVGENNCGKTSILEALEVFLSKGNIQAFKNMLVRRLESPHIRRKVSTSEISNSEFQDIVDVEKVFFGRTLDIKKTILISARTFDRLDSLEISVSEYPLGELIGVGVLIRGDHVGKTPDGLYINNRFFSEQNQSSIDDQKAERINYESLMSTLVNSKTAKDLYEDIVLTSAEQDLIEVLQVLDPRIQKIAVVTKNNLSIFYVRLSGNSNRIPLGSMGDGMWRMMSIALTLVTAKGGVVLVDEIDTGLHYTAMEGMWSFIWKIAKKLDVQIFATTHSSDCWQSLAVVAEEEDTTDDRITIHRIEKGASQSVMFDEEEMAIAAERGIEVR